MAEQGASLRGWPVGWLAGLGALAATCAGLAVWLCWWAAQLFHEVDVYYRSSTGSTAPPDAVARYYDTLSHNSGAMQAALSPLLAGAVLTVLVALAALALLWERRESAQL